MKNSISEAERSLKDISIGVHIDSDRPVSASGMLIRCTIACLAILGSVFSFVTAISNSGIYNFEITAVLLVTILFWMFYSVAYTLYYTKRKISRAMVWISVLSLILYGAVRYEELSYGFRYFVNTMLGALITVYEETPYFDLSGLEICGDNYVTETLCYICIFICLLVCRGAVGRTNIYLMVFPTVPFTILCFFYDLVPDYLFFGMTIASWAGALAMECSVSSVTENRSHRNFFTGVSTISAAAAACTIIIIYSVVVFACADFTRPKSVDNLRLSVIEYMRTFSWQKLRSDIRETIYSKDSTSTTHDGKLGDNEKIEFTGNSMIEVTLPLSADSLYLKGFTGVNYTGSKWTAGPPMPETKTEISSPEFLSGRMLKYVGGFENLAADSVIVRNTGIVEQTRYYPVNAAGLLETDGTRRKFGVYFPEDLMWRNRVLSYRNEIEADESLAEDELAMRMYADTYCMDVPSSFTAAEEFFGDEEFTSLAGELEYIRKKLAETCEYSLEPGKKPFATDFAQWFLTDSRKGSCTHFATAATLLCRSGGIPARYCEGFIIKNEDIASGEINGDYSCVTVPDSRGHAWVEVYVDNYGWMSYEFTPGYGNMVSDENGDYSEITEVTTCAPAHPEELTANAVTVTTSPDEKQSHETSVISMNTGSAADNGSQRPQTSYDREEYDETGYGGAQIPDYTDLEAPVAPKPVPAGIPMWVKVLAVILSAAVLMAVRIPLTLAIRRKKIKTSPRKAMREIYYMSLKTAKKLDISFDDRSVLDTDKVSSPWDTVIAGGNASRFSPDVTEEDALKTAEAYSIIMKQYCRDDRLRYLFCRFVLINYRYI